MLINQIHARHQRITQHIGFGLLPSPFGTLLPAVATSYMLGTLAESGERKWLEHKS